MSQHCMQANNMHFTVIILTGRVGIGCQKLSSVPKLAKMFTGLSLMIKNRPTGCAKGTEGKDCPNYRDFKRRNIIERIRKGKKNKKNVIRHKITLKPISRQSSRDSLKRQSSCYRWKGDSFSMEQKPFNRFNIIKTSTLH